MRRRTADSTADWQRLTEEIVSAPEGEQEASHSSSLKVVMQGGPIHSHCISKHDSDIQYCAKVSGTCKKSSVKRWLKKKRKKKETFLHFHKRPINSSMQVKTKSNHILLWLPFTFKTASVLLGTLSCSFIRKPAGRLFQTYQRTCHSSADFGSFTFF